METDLSELARDIGADAYAEDAAAGARRALELLGAGERTG